jgi:hypothetical protein
MLITNHLFVLFMYCMTNHKTSIQTHCQDCFIHHPRWVKLYSIFKSIISSSPRPYYAFTTSVSTAQQPRASRNIEIWGQIGGVDVWKIILLNSDEYFTQSLVDKSVSHEVLVRIRSMIVYMSVLIVWWYDAQITIVLHGWLVALGRKWVHEVVALTHLPPAGYRCAPAFHATPLKIDTRWIGSIE